MRSRSTLAIMKFFPRKKAAPEDLGLESIRFDTLGLTREPEEASNERDWFGPNLWLAQHWFPIPPDFPSLKEEEIRRTYEAPLGDQGDVDGRTPRLLHVAVHRETPVPTVCTLIRGVVPGDDRYSFIGGLTLPLAGCSWVIKVRSSEGPITGVREALAFHRFSKEQPLPDQSIEELASTFNPSSIPTTNYGTPIKMIH